MEVFLFLQLEQVIMFGHQTVVVRVHGQNQNLFGLMTIGILNQVILHYLIEKLEGTSPLLEE